MRECTICVRIWVFLELSYCFFRDLFLIGESAVANEMELVASWWVNSFLSLIRCDALALAVLLLYWLWPPTPWAKLYSWLWLPLLPAWLLSPCDGSGVQPQWRWCSASVPFMAIRWWRRWPLLHLRVFGEPFLSMLPWPSSSHGYRFCWPSIWRPAAYDLGSVVVVV
jgi:hypothetical protein